MKFYPALLSDSLEVIAYQLEIVKSLPQVKRVQIDILDGLFADNLTVSVSDLVELNFGDLELDLHLMVEEPIDCVHELLECHSSIPVKTVIAQIERMSFQDQYVAELKDQKIEIGMSLDLFTPLTEIKEDIFSDLNCVQLMAIEAGFQGQTLNEMVYKKITALKSYIAERQSKCEIIVDGGVKLDNLEKLKQAGADAVAVGSMLWTADNPKKIAEKISSV